jgi:hypothetical protein
VRRHATAAALALLLAACVPVPGDRLELRPSQLELPVDHDDVLVVDVWQGGKRASPADVSFESTRPAVARAAPGARVEAITVGSTTVAARWRQLRSNSVTVRVIPEYRQEEGRTWGSDGWIEMGAYLGELREGDQLGQQAARPGMRLVWLHAWVQNRLRPTYRPQLDGFALLDAQGTRYPAARGPGVNALPSDFPTRDLGAFEYGFGWLLFEIPASARVSALQYQDGPIATLRVPLLAQTK